jgi:hypothetical protein
MAIPTLNAVGYCAHYSEEGDSAFDYALRLTRMHGVQLNVFHFLADPYDSTDLPPKHLPCEELAELVVERERELRLHYDTRAGDYLEVGFRLCEDNEWTELHRCLVDREFQILVLGYVGQDATFAGKPIEEFADSFVCPVVLVGPGDPQRFYLNGPAALISDKLGLPESSWTKIELVPS